MATKIDQKTYLQKYLSGGSKDKKKKKKKSFKGKGLKIIVDTEVDVGRLRALDGDELDVLGEGEDAPQVAGIVDDRPEELRRMDQLTTTKWRVISQDDGFNSKLQIEEIKRDVKEQQKENEVVFGKMYSDSEDEKDQPQKTQNGSKQQQKKQNSDSDLSPPRNKGQKKNYDSDLSPPRKHSVRDEKKERVRKSRWGHFEPESSNNGPKLNRRRSNDSELTNRKSPETRIYQQRSSSRSPRKRQKSSDSDMSIPRKSRKKSPKSSNHRKHRRKSSDSDLSPPRSKASKHRRKSSDSDLSPPRKSQKASSKSVRRDSSDSDLSPPRRSQKESSNRSNQYSSRNSNSPPPTHKKMSRTLDGKLAGLQDATQLKKENEAFRRREDEVFSKMNDEVSGRNAKAVSRKSGKKRETSEERRKQQEKAVKQKELDEKYKKWSKGLKQVEAQEARIQDYIHEAAKPLARHRDDADLEKSLKEIDRAGDPMLQYIRERRKERGELPPEKPQYKGRYPPNRFNIRPGHRWDGVDRSNGYENKYFEAKSKKKAQEEEYHKWCSADM